MRRKIFHGIVVLAVLGLAFLGWAIWMSGILHRSAAESKQVARSVPSAAAVATRKAWAEPQFASVIARGEYLARVGDCVACHTMRGGKPYAGGLATPTPFGLLYSPNITPDKQYGIGNWTEDDFWRAMHDGIAPGNKLLYPVFPFTHFTKVSRPDVDAIFAYLRSLPPAAQPNHPNEMPFPYNQRSSLVFWRALFFRAGEFKPNPGKSPEWNRGAYLVEGLGHCGMCHSSFNALGATDKNAQLAGGLIPIQRWYAPALNSGAEVGLGNWTNDELAQFLKTGVSVRGQPTDRCRTWCFTACNTSRMRICRLSPPICAHSPFWYRQATCKRSRFRRSSPWNWRSKAGRFISTTAPSVTNSTGAALASSIHHLPATLRSRCSPAPTPFAWCCWAVSSPAPKATHARIRCRRSPSC